MQADAHYSGTWQGHISTQRVKLSPGTFHLSNAFRGLYDTPSPFPNVEKWSLAGPASPAAIFRRIFVKLRHVRRFRRDFQKLQSHPDFAAVAEYLPPMGHVGGGLLTPFAVAYRGRKVNGSFLKAAEQLKNISETVPASHLHVACEIGGEFGAFAETFIQRHHPALYFIIDLPETLQVSSLYLESVFPGAVQTLIPGRPLQSHAGTSIVLVNAPDAGHIRTVATVTLFVNSNSFAEMSLDVVRQYFALIESFPGTYFSNTNRCRQEGGHMFDGPDTYPYSSAWEFLLVRNQDLPNYRRNRQMIALLAAHSRGSSSSGSYL